MLKDVDVMSAIFTAYSLPRCPCGVTQCASIFNYLKKKLEMRRHYKSESSLLKAMIKKLQQGDIDENIFKKPSAHYAVSSHASAHIGVSALAA